MSLVGKYFPMQPASAPPSSVTVDRPTPLLRPASVPVPGNQGTTGASPPPYRLPSQTQSQSSAGAMPSASSPQPPAATSTPAALARPDRVMKHLRVVARDEDLPRYISVLTAVGQMFEVPVSQQRVCAALQVDDRTATIAWTNGPDGRSARQHLHDRLVQKGFAVREEIECNDVLIASLNLGAADRRSGLIGLQVEADHIDSALDKMIKQALIMRASDVHFEVSANGTLVRFRIHGELYVIDRMTFDDALNFSRGIYLRSESGTKGIQFSERACQDSSIRREVDTGDGKLTPTKLRFASRPAYPEGWDITLRVLSTKSSAEDVETFDVLGYDRAQVEAIEYMVAQPRGVILVVGETGSGKSTSLRSMCYWLHDRSGGKHKMISVEDPPEYILPGRQTPVLRTKEEEEARIDPFARYLRSAMRGDPDVLLVGEVRDEDTARAMVTASLSGHKVLATMHTGSPFDAFPRLEEMGVKRGILAAPKFVSGIIFQKLIQVLCPDCAVGFDAMQSSLHPKLNRRLMAMSSMMSANDYVDRIRFRGPGCERCRSTIPGLAVSGPVGVIGRTVVAEMLVPDAQVLALIGRGDMLGATRYWRAAAYKESKLDSRGIAMGRTVMDQAIQKMLDGLLDPRDVERSVGLLDDQESAREAWDWWTTQNVSAKVAQRRIAE